MNITAPPVDKAICPQCGNSTPLNEGLRRWCEGCNWNLTSKPDEEESDFLARSYRRLGERQGEKVLAELLAEPVEGVRPGMTPARVGALATAGLVHLVSLGILIIGLVVAFLGYPSALALIAAALCMGMAWLLLPRPVPASEKVLAPKAFPAFRALVAEIIGMLGGKPIEHIVIDEDFNASYAVAGWRRQPVLTVGLPLWIALAPQERIALIAHEVAHGVNHDSTRGFWVGSALGALDEWIGLLRPRHRAVTISEVLARFVTSLISMPLVLLQSLLLHLLWQEKQRAEYFADHLAASVAGTPATLGLLHRFALEEHLEDVLMRHAYSSAQSGSYILGLFRSRLDSLPAREWERMRRASEAEGARLDKSHPPTAFRIAFLEAHTIGEPKVIVSAATMAEVDTELRSLEDKLGRKLIARFARD